jgi:hypothetical protein
MNINEHQEEKYGCKNDIATYSIMLAAASKRATSSA